MPWYQKEVMLHWHDADSFQSGGDLPWRPPAQSGESSAGHPTGAGVCIKHSKRLKRDPFQAGSWAGLPVHLPPNESESGRETTAFLLMWPSGDAATEGLTRDGTGFLLGTPLSLQAPDSRGQDSKSVLGSSFWWFGSGCQSAPVCLGLGASRNRGAFHGESRQAPDGPQCLDHPGSAHDKWANSVLGP